MVLGKGIGFQKNIASKLGSPPIENLIPLSLTPSPPANNLKLLTKVHKLYQFLPSYSFLPVSRLVPRQQCEQSLNAAYTVNLSLRE